MTGIPIVELKPCPFCGGPAKMHQDYIYGTEKRDPKGWFVRCDPCDLIHDDAWAQPFAEAAAKGWNTRAPDPALKECVEALEEYGEHKSGCRLRMRMSQSCICGWAEKRATLAAMTKGEE